MFAASIPVKCALKSAESSRTVAGNDIPGLVAAYCLPERRMLDRPQSIPLRLGTAWRLELICLKGKNKSIGELSVSLTTLTTYIYNNIHIYIVKYIYIYNKIHIYIIYLIYIYIHINV